MFKFFTKCALVFVTTFSLLDVVDHYTVSSDKYAKSKAIMLIGAGSCSGEQIIAPSGKTYILTAGHCKDLAGAKQTMTVKTANGKTLERAIVAEDTDSDLLLLEGLPNVAGLEIAEMSSLEQHVRTFTHGAGLPTYKTEGILIGDKTITIKIDDGLTSVCEGKKYAIIYSHSLFGEDKVCALRVKETISTAMVVPGSSGGMVVDDNGEVVGVVSATDGAFAYFVTLSDIKAFLAGY